MLNFFGLPILMAFAVGYYFPYIALSLSKYAFIILFTMMTASALQIKWKLLNRVLTNKNELVFGLFFLFLFFPIVQWFLAKIFITEISSLLTFSLMNLMTERKFYKLVTLVYLRSTYKL